MSLTGYHEKTAELSNDLITHGFGQFTFKVEKMKDHTRKIIIECGKSYVYFVKDTIPFDHENIF